MYKLFEIANYFFRQPAVTLGVCITRNMGILQGILYLFAQFIGSICGAAYGYQIVIFLQPTAWYC